MMSRNVIFSFVAITEINETESETYSKDVSHPPQKEMLQSRKEHKHRRTQSMSVNMNQESEMMLLSTSPVDKEEPNKQKKSTKDEKEKYILTSKHYHTNSYLLLLFFKYYNDDLFVCIRTRNPFRLITAQISSLVRHDNKESNVRIICYIFMFQSV
jgi:DNA polymerase sigma